jgi:hypothetical protein
MKKSFICLAIPLVLADCFVCAAREPKEFDSDVNYNEEKVPHYD